MTAPDLIEVRFTEDLAQYADIRPVRIQPMTLAELVGLVLTHTGKDRERVRELLHGGSCTYNIYKYWWEPVDPDYTELEVALDSFPDPDPERVFDPACCQLIRFSDLAEPLPHMVEFSSEEGSKRRLFVREKLWPFLLRFAASHDPAYLDYSYQDKADLFAVDLSGSLAGDLTLAVRRLAAGALRRRLKGAAGFVRLELLCSRPS